MVHQRLATIKRIIISIGHDPQNVGATYKSDKENTLAADIAQHTARFLLANGVKVWVMPDLELSKTVKEINKVGNRLTDMAIEIHKDSCGDDYDAERMNRRCGLYYLADSAGAGSIAKNLVLSLIANGAHNTSWARIDKDSPRKRLAFVRDTKVLTFIYEAGFIEGSNAHDENEWYAWVLTKAILNALQKPIVSTPINFTTIPPIL
jgi:N-acetylmuramoyl-L-alanine amidase